MRKLRVEFDLHKFPDTSRDWVLEAWGPRHWWRIRRELLWETRYHWWPETGEQDKRDEVAWQVKALAAGRWGRR